MVPHRSHLKEAKKEGRLVELLLLFVKFCATDSLISNFIISLQENHILCAHGGKKNHCSLNIDTQTGRSSARRPNLQETTRRPPFLNYIAPWPLIYYPLWVFCCKFVDNC